MMLHTLILLTAGVFTQSTSTELDAIVDRLDAPRWIDRETAMYEVAHVSSGITVDQITSRLQSGGLSLEQVVRLLRAVEIRLLHSPRGLGVNAADEFQLPAATGRPVRD